MHLEDFFSLDAVWSVDKDLTVETSGSEQR